MKLFDSDTWKKNNELNYGAIKSYDRRFDADLHPKGFLHKYAVINKLEDFISFAELIFMNNPAFWEAADKYEKLRNKFEITCGFYESQDPVMTREYFLRMNEVALSER